MQSRACNWKLWQRCIWSKANSVHGSKGPKMQGMIMGPRTAASMLLGAVAGYGVLGPLAQRQGWAPGPIGDWETGATGWILWISLSIMLADSLTSLTLLLVSTLRSTLAYKRCFTSVNSSYQAHQLKMRDLQQHSLLPTTQKTPLRPGISHPDLFAFPQPPPTDPRPWFNGLASAH